MQKKWAVAEVAEAVTSMPESPVAERGRPEVWPFYDDDEIAAVTTILRGGHVNQWTGDRVRTFERCLADYCGVKYAIALANGSLALELALRALGIGSGDEVIVTSRSFIASASCVDLVGAKPVFADVDPKSQNISAETIAPLITPRTKAIIPVHLAGWPCDMQPILELAQRHNLFVIEDCAQAIGATIDGRQVGSFGHASVFSFCQDKIISTGGEGGALLLNDEALWRFAWSYKDHGKDWDMATAPASGTNYRWLHTQVGTNWRMTEMQAAIGIVQMGKLDAWLAKRNLLARTWIDQLRQLECLEIPVPPANLGHAWYKFYAFVKPERLVAGTGRDELLSLLSGKGVRAFFGSCPEIYREAAYKHLRQERLPVARRLGETSLMFEVHPTLRQETVHETAKRLVEIVKPLQVSR
jgi:dTDP-4-amino-4,6-dideoxygalactose transaminase